MKPTVVSTALWNSIIIPLILPKKISIIRSDFLSIRKLVQSTPNLIHSELTAIAQNLLITLWLSNTASRNGKGSVSIEC